MRRYLLLFICCIISYTFAENNHLIRMDFDRTVAQNFKVVHISRTQCLVLATETQIQRLRLAEKPFTLLQRNPTAIPGAEYYAVYPDASVCPRIDRDLYARYGQVLDVFNQHLIMKGDADVILSNGECPVRLKEISLRSSLDPYRKRTIIRDDPVVQDPLIEKMLENVNPDSCAVFLRELCGIYNRFADEQYNIEEVVPYIEDKFLAYNCDTVLRLPVSGYDAPAIVGIKWGVENANLDQVCVIGAHPDNISKDGGRHQGAWDNGCGCVGFLEAARTMKDFTFTNTICYVGFNAEEVGMKGSLKFIDLLEEENSQILGGAITYDMLGLTYGSSTAGSHTISTTPDGGQEFADKMEEVCGVYDVPVSVNATSSTSLPTDTENFWKAGFSASCGKGGQGSGVFHEKGDTITDFFDSTWLALAVSPGIVTLAWYAEPVDMTVADVIQQPLSVNPVVITTSYPGFVSITFSDSREVAHKSVSVFTVSGKLIRTLALSREEGSQYRCTWDRCDSQGAVVAKGLYMITITIGNQQFQEKVVIR